MKKNNDSLPPSSDPASKVHHPHDKYMRALLQEKEFVIQLLQFALRPDILEILDLNSIKLTNNTYISPELLGSYSDICYEGLTKSNKPFRVSFIFEHKSDNPGVAIYDQLGRYIFDNWAEDRRQGRSLTLSIPVLIHHGDTPVTLQTPAHLFPDAPNELLSYVPTFIYDIIDIATLSVDDIMALRFWTLRNAFLALKIGRDEKEVARHLKKILIFASDEVSPPTYIHLLELTLLYLSKISKIANMAISNIDTFLTEEEKEQMPPLVFKKYFDEGIEEGTILTIQRYIKKHPDDTDSMIADLFEVTIEMVRRARSIRD